MDENLQRIWWSESTMWFQICQFIRWKPPGSSQWPDPSEGEREIWRNDSSFNSKAGFPIKTNLQISDALLAGCCAMLCVLGFGIIKSRELVFFRRVVNIEKWYTAATSLFLHLSPACPINNRKQLLWTKNCFSKHRSHYFSHFAH